MAKIYTGRNRRRVFRLRLPRHSLLKATIEGDDYEVLEVAEFSVLVNASDVANKNGKCKGTVFWSDGSQSEFTGEIGRLNGEHRVIVGVRGIMMSDVIGEQRRILRLNPSSSLRKPA